MFFTHWFSSFAPNVVLTCLDKDKEALRALNLLRGSQTDFKQEIMTRTLNLNTLGIKKSVVFFLPPFKETDFISVNSNFFQLVPDPIFISSKRIDAFVIALSEDFIEQVFLDMISETCNRVFKRQAYLLEYL